MLLCTKPFILFLLKISMKVFSTSVMLLFVIVFLSMAIVEGAGATLRGNTFTYADSGTLDKPNNITLQDAPLFIIDQENGFLKAYFNLPEGEFAIPNLVNVDFPNTFFSNTSTGFLGDVDNFDNRNGFSRFREINLNNGTNAAAGFLGVNNIGRTISLGIGSSNFQFLNLSLPNLGALRLNSPSVMVFANQFFNGWLWVTDLNNGTNFTAPFVAMDLEPTGNLSIGGNFTVNNTITFPHTDSATTQAGSVRMFCKSSDRCFIQLSNGQERRLIDGGGGSLVIDEQINFIVTQHFEDGINVTNNSNIFSDGDINTTGVVCDKNGCIEPIIFGAEFEVFQNLSESSTGSLSFQSKLDVTTTSKPAGTYKITFYSDVTGALVGSHFNVKYSVDNVSISPHDNGEDYYTLDQKRNDDWQTLVATQYKVLGNASTIDLNVEWNRGDNDVGNIARISNVVIEVWRVS